MTVYYVLGTEDKEVDKLLPLSSVEKSQVNRYGSKNLYGKYHEGNNKSWEKLVKWITIPSLGG